MIRNFFLPTLIFHLLYRKAGGRGNGSLDITFINLLCCSCSLCSGFHQQCPQGTPGGCAQRHYPLGHLPFGRYFYIAVIFAIPMLRHTPSVEGGGFIYELLNGSAESWSYFLSASLITNALNYMLIPYMMERYKLHGIETRDYTTLILGASHGSSNINPDILREKYDQEGCLMPAWEGSIRLILTSCSGCYPEP